MSMDNVTLENTQQSISSRDAKSVASVMVNGKWVNLSDTLEQANVKSDVGTVSKQVAEQQTMITSAVAQADSAVAYANDAIEKSRVNSQAIVEINSAVSDAVSDAAVARSDGLRAWDAAQSNVDLIDQNYASASAAISSARTEAIAAADEAKASASAAQADIVAVRSDVAAVQADVTATQSDVAVAKSDIADTKTSLASQAKSLSSYAAQASAAGKDITTLKSQAGQLEQDMADIKGDVSQLKVSASSASVALSDAAGNISSLQATAKSYSAALSDTNNNVASVTATASELETKYADAAGDINKLQTDASGTKQTLTNAKSDIAVLQSRADGFDAKYADVAGDINTIKVNAKGMQQTLTNAKGDISTLQATATGFKNTLTDAQGNISTLQSDVAGLKKTTSDHAGNIATLQADAKTLTSQMSSAQGDISTLKQTASGFSSRVSGMETSLANANSKINGITSNGGGRNLILGTALAKCNLPNSGAEGGHISLDTLKSLRGQWVTISCDMSWTGFARSEKNKNRIGYELGLHYSDGTSLYISNWYNPSDSEVDKSFRFGRSCKLLDKELTSIDEGWLYNQIDATTCVTSKLMIEKGTVAHDWSPAPEDTDAKITTNSTAIEQNKKAIALKADQTTVDKTNGDVKSLQSQLKVQADQISSKVSSSDLKALNDKLNNMKIGTRNLLHHSDTFDGWAKGNLVTITSDKYLNGTIAVLGNTGIDGGSQINTSLDGPYDNQPVTWTVYAKADNVGDKLHTELWGGGGYTDQPLTNNWQTYQFTGQRNINDHDFYLWGCQGNKGNIYVALPFAVVGNMIGTWEPNPEDTQAYTQTYTQTQIKQTADSWNANLTSVKDGLTQSYTNLHATVDGIQAQVYNSDGSSRITQLSNLIATKVSSDDYNSQITQLKNDINLRVAKGNVVSQINQEAGGNTLIQVSGGKGKLALNASSVIFSGSAFIPDAYISTLNADKLRFYDSYGNVATMSANLVQHDDDKVARTINLQYNGGYEVHASNTLGSILTMHDDTIRLAVKSSGSSGDQYSGVYAMTHYTQLSNYRSDGSAPGVFIYDDQFNILGDANGAGTSKGDMHISSPQLYLNGSSKLQAGGDHALLTIASDYTTIHADKNVWMETGNTQLHLDNSNNLEIFNKNNTNTSNYDVHLTVRGWATFTGWVNCLGLTQTSRLSTKTNIERLDTARALELINSADVATYQYKQDVANGGTKRHASVIIDDVNDVARYQTPDEFISEDRSGRNDGDIVGYLMGAVQELTKKFKTLESKVG